MDNKLLFYRVSCIPKLIILLKKCVRHIIILKIYVCLYMYYFCQNCVKLLKFQLFKSLSHSTLYQFDSAPERSGSDWVDQRFRFPPSHRVFNSPPSQILYHCTRNWCFLNFSGVCNDYRIFVLKKGFFRFYVCISKKLLLLITNSQLVGVWPNWMLENLIISTRKEKVKMF